MNTICTSLEQSKRLIELGVDVNTADMHYSTWTILNGGEYILSPNQGETIEELQESYGNQVIPTWSITALLGLMPFHLIVNNQRYAFSMHKGLNKYGETYMFRYNIFNTDICLYSTDYYNSPIDAAFEMVCWLKENNKI